MVSRSFTSSSASIRPLPRTSPITGYFRWSSSSSGAEIIAHRFRVLKKFFFFDEFLTAAQSLVEREGLPMLAFAQKPTAAQPDSARSPASSQAKRNSGPEPGPAPPIQAGMRRPHPCPCGGGCPKCRSGRADVHAVLAEPGHPLDQATQSFVQSRLGHDFNQVRVHTDARAGASAQALNAVCLHGGPPCGVRPGTIRPSHQRRTASAGARTDARPAAILRHYRAREFPYRSSR